jgi:hypothetical protein
VSNAAIMRLQKLCTGRTSISDGQLYTCSYAQLLVLMGASAHGTAVLAAIRPPSLCGRAAPERSLCDLNSKEVVAERLHRATVAPPGATVQRRKIPLGRINEYYTTAVAA